MLALEFIKQNDSAGARQQIDTLRLFRATLGKEFLADFNHIQDLQGNKVNDLLKSLFSHFNSIHNLDSSNPQPEDVKDFYQKLQLTVF